MLIVAECVSILQSSAPFGNIVHLAMFFCFFLVSGARQKKAFVEFVFIPGVGGSSVGGFCLILAPQS